MLNVADNSGAKRLMVIRVLGGYKKRYAGLGDVVTASVKVAAPHSSVKKGQVVHAVIVRQKKEYRRPDGIRVKFEDNSAVVLKDEKGNPKGTIFKGVIAKEAIQRWSPIGKVAKVVV